MIDTNVKGLVWMTKAVVPAMITRNRGHIINISRSVSPGVANLFSGHVWAQLEYGQCGRR